MPALYGVLSLVLVAGALTFALSSPPPSTPPLAEVAPAPQDQIEVERVEQSSQFGEGGGGEGECLAGDPGCEGASAEAADEQDAAPQPETVRTSAPGSLRYCYNGGLTQTPDPQSPPCVSEIFQGDNGGATWKGVSPTSIRIAVAGGYDDRKTCSEQQRELLPRLAAHFNQHYELYGRELEVVCIGAGAGDVHDPAVQRAYAEELAAADVFAVVQYSGFGTFNRTLADHGVLSTVGRGRLKSAPAGRLQELAPHVWAINPTIDEAVATTGALICGSLAGRPASHGGPDVAAEPRRFGVVAEQPAAGSNHHYDPTQLTNRLRACGVEATVAVARPDDDRTVLLRRLQDEQVTTVVCLCDGLDPDYLYAADDVGYTPEWLLPGIDDHDIRLRGRATSSGEDAPRSQLAHVFGLTGQLRRSAADVKGGASWGDQYWFHAAREADPDYAYSNQSYDHDGYSQYAELLILASGIQAAGPELTPRTFGDGLTSLRFPNPGVGQAPWYQPAVAFGASDRALNSDFALVWWRDPDDAGYQARTDLGELCYVGGGARFTVADLPTDADELFFNPEEGCR